MVGIKGSSDFQFMLGNHAIAEGAIAAGCRFFAGYPITPANEISERMSERLLEVGGKFIQMEDELGSIYAVIGASLAGVKAMTATASAGYNYMQEGIEFAVATETPIVIVDVMRIRGAEQPTHADIMQARWGAAGDHEMIVLVPSSVQELFDFTIEAFNLSEKYRNPVVVLSEMTISLMREKIRIPPPEEIMIINRKHPTVPPEKFLPFEAEEDGVPPMARFGEGYRVLYTINPHDKRGMITGDLEIYEKMYQRIIGKIIRNLDDIVKFKEYFIEDADIAIVTYGSEARAALEAVRMARADGIKAGLLKLITVWPFHDALIRSLAERVKKIIVPEINIGKYYREVQRACEGITKVVSLPINRGRMHSPKEILSKIRSEM
ncbi:MAG: 2-oxoacid:acceptor oxidoreductase subunit alpha [Candidatus Bathyarchaeia archaeon]